MQVAQYNSSIQTVDELPKYCSQLVEKLVQQPLLGYEHADLGKCRLIFLDDYSDARICEIFFKNANVNVSGKRLQPFDVRYFSARDIKVYDVNVIPTDGLCIRAEEEAKQASSKYLEPAFTMAIKLMRKNWKHTEIKSCPGICCMRDSTEFALFIKELSFLEESALIRFISIKFSLSDDDVMSDNEWIDGDNIVKGKTYLWIKKSSFAVVAKVFGFLFLENEDSKDKKEGDVKEKFSASPS